MHMFRSPTGFAMRRLNECIVFVVLLLVVCLSPFGVAYAGTTDPTPSQIVSAIKRAHIEGIAAGDPSLASRFVLYRCCGSYASGPPVYGAHPDDPGDHFDLSHVMYVDVNGQHLVLFRYVQGNDAWRDFAFFVGSLNYAGQLPVVGPNNRYQTVGPNLVVRLHTLQGSDAMCCPSGPWRTIATLSANSHGLFAVTADASGTPTTRTASVGAASPAHPTGAGSVVQQFYTWLIPNQGSADLASESGLFDDRFYWLLKQENLDHPGSKPGYECARVGTPDFGLLNGLASLSSFTLGAPIARGNAIAVPVTLFFRPMNAKNMTAAVVSKNNITVIVKNEGGAYKIYDINDGGDLQRQDLERFAHDPNCMWPK